MDEVKVDPKVLRGMLVGHGLSEAQAREISVEFSRNGDCMEDAELASRFSGMGLTIYQLTSIFRKLGLSGENAIRMFERKEKQILGGQVDNLEVII